MAQQISPQKDLLIPPFDFDICIGHPKQEL